MAITEYYVDTDIGTDTGTGTTLGDPWGAATGSKIARAIGLITPNPTDGDRINVIGTASDTLLAALDGSAWASTAPLIIRGIQSDGSAANYETGVGMATLDLNGGAYAVAGATDNIHFYHLDITNGASTSIVPVATFCAIVECYVSNSAASGIILAASAKAIKCSVSNCATYGIYSAAANPEISSCYVKSTAGDSRTAMTAGVFLTTSATEAVVSDNIISLDGATDGISATEWGLVCRGNSILAAAGSGTGITNPAAAKAAYVTDNLTEGFSNSGVGIAYGTQTSASALLGNNAIYNCSTLSSGDPSFAAVSPADITLTETPFSKLASDTFANRANYFAPRNTGGIQTGAFL